MEKAILLEVKEENGMIAQSIKAIDFEKEADGLGFYYKNLNCECIDIVHAYGLKAKELEMISLVVDDEALLKGEPVMNLIGSLLYGSMDHGQPLCGSVMICKDKYTDEGIETVGLTEDEVTMVYANIEALLREFEARNK